MLVTTKVVIDPFQQSISGYESYKSMLKSIRTKDDI